MGRVARPFGNQFSWSQSFWNQLRNPLPNRLMLSCGVAGLLLVFACTLFAPLLAPFSPSAIGDNAYLQPPNATHWFGTDDLGRDLLSRLLWGGRTTLGMAVLSVGIALLTGSLIGVAAGYAGGWLDGFLMRIVDVIMAFPPFLFILGMAAALGAGLLTLVVALSIVSLPEYARLVRSLVLTIRHRDYILAAHVNGVSRYRLVTRHILPNVASVLTVYSTISLGNALMITTGLSFLGLGAQPPTPEWGMLLSEGLPFLRHAWWMTVLPGMTIFLTALSINLVGDGLRK